MNPTYRVQWHRGTGMRTKGWKDFITQTTGMYDMTMVAAQRIAARKTYGGGENTIPGYLEQEVLLWSPEKITLKTYDLFIISAKRRDVRRMNKVLNELISALNFDIGELPQRMHRLYDYCQRCVQNRRYDEAANIIIELRDAWEKTFNLSS